MMISRLCALHAMRGRFTKPFDLIKGVYDKRKMQPDVVPFACRHSFPLIFISFCDEMLTENVFSLLAQSSIPLSGLCTCFLSSTPTDPPPTQCASVHTRVARSPCSSSVICLYATGRGRAPWAPTVRATATVRPREKERLLLLSMTFGGKSIYQPSLARLLATATATARPSPRCRRCLLWGDIHETSALWGEGGFAQNLIYNERRLCDADKRGGGKKCRRLTFTSHRPLRH